MTSVVNATGLNFNHHKKKVLPIAPLFMSLHVATEEPSWVMGYA
jgi:hypothetical protein